MFGKEPLHDLPVGVKIEVPIIAAVMVGLGLVLLLSPPSRFANPGWVYAVAVFGHIQTAGILYLALGGSVFAAIASQRALIAALTGCAVYLTFWSVLSMLTYTNYEHTTLVGSVLYSGYAVACYSIIATIRQWRRLRGD